MFGFGSNDKKKDEVKRTVEVKKQEEDINWARVESLLGGTFGMTDIDRIYKMYMPELSEAILSARDHVVANYKSFASLSPYLENKFSALEQQNEEIKKQNAEFKQQNAEMQRKNQELQEKYNALVERMAKYIEKENARER